ncbi:AN1-type zinc finger protein 1 isoform X3 [Mus caroli]|uniref:AN1-type zinc finger protein 1 n=1 Tax=Mus caroli TaxID=10089 RepID=A0A6P5PFU8_MUSCR|nr:AN1-type zinc finger protein 1 isoform X3 [Mus caroli]
MAELDIGQHCQVQHCRQRDFLPFVCDGCSGIFCLEHRSKDSHGCSEVNVIKERPKADEHESYSCSFKGCTEVELVAVICPYCEKNFCLRHRHQSDHDCEKLEVPKPRMAATQKLVRDIVDAKTGGAASKGRKGAKSSGTAAKVALMKLKMHADGDKSLPQKEHTSRYTCQRGARKKAKPCSFACGGASGRSWTLQLLSLISGMKTTS